ncbi:MAG: hypothetical protein Q8O19_01595, partial [Rectinemataceae bacterium]|nr:hypothetical protein [Rectinemataceae bacterium]
PSLTRLTANSLNSAVYSCFGIFFIVFLSKVTLILRHPWKTIFRGKVTAEFMSTFSNILYWRADIDIGKRGAHLSTLTVFLEEAERAIADASNSPTKSRAQIK